MKSKMIAIIANRRIRVIAITYAAIVLGVTTYVPWVWKVHPFMSEFGAMMGPMSMGHSFIWDPPEVRYNDKVIPPEISGVEIDLGKVTFRLAIVTSVFLGVALFVSSRCSEKTAAGT